MAPPARRYDELTEALTFGESLFDYTGTTSARSVLDVCSRPRCADGRDGLAVVESMEAHDKGEPEVSGSLDD